MKICDKCGAVHRDNKTFCVDCGEKLPPPIPKEKETAVKFELNKKIEHLHQESDPLAVTLPMKIAAVLNVLGAIASIVVLMNSYYIQYPFIAIILHLTSFFEAIFPKIGWNLTKLEDILKYENGEFLQPSSWYGTSRKIAVWAGLAIGIFLTLFALLQ